MCMIRWTSFAYGPTLIVSAIALVFSVLTLLGPQSRFGDNPLNFQVVRPQNGTAVLKGSRMGVSLVGRIRTDAGGTDFVV